MHKGALWVQVVDDAGAPLAGAQVRVDGATKTTDEVGLTAFDPLDPGPHPAELLPVSGSLSEHSLPAVTTQSGPVVAGDIALLKFVLTRPINKVAPILKLEGKVALLERGLSAHQPAAETKLFATPTFVEVGFTQDHVQTQPFAGGGALVFDAAKVDVFADKECTTPWADGGVLTYGQLNAKQKLWLRGKAAGKFDLKLKLDDAADALIEIQPEATEEFGVVKVELELHEHAEAAPYAAAAMSDQDKIQRGRLVHKQTPVNDHARAKLVLKATDESHWPGGCDGYVVELKPHSTSGAVTLYIAADGAAIAPRSYTKSVLGADQTLWVGGADECTALRDVRIDAGLKAAGGELKEHGDWVHFTVVRVEAVKPSDQFPAESAEYTGGIYRHFINVRPAAAGGGAMEGHADARKIKLKAKLLPAVAGVKLHFLLVPDGANGKAANWGVDKPASWNAIGAELLHIDRDGGGLHFSADTDASGLAEVVDLKLSQFGGDKFKAGAYIGQDVHFREFDATDPAKSTRRPTRSLDIAVWRKVWYRTLRDVNLNAPLPAAAVAQYERVKVVLEAGPPMTFQPTDAWVPAGTYYPRSMIEPGKTSVNDVAVMGDHNKAAFFARFAADAARPLEAKVAICQHQWDSRDGAVRHTGVKTITMRSGSKTVTMDQAVFNPPLLGALIHTASYVTTKHAAGHPAHRSGTLTAANLDFATNRSSRKTVTITLPPGTGVGMLNPIEVTLKLKAAFGPYLGESSGPRIMAVFNPSDVPDFNDTIVHEIGHSLGQTPQRAAAPDPKNTQPNSIPDHPDQRLGQGNHCTHRSCVMYESGPQPTARHRFCSVCHPYLLVEDMTSLR